MAFAFNSITTNNAGAGSGSVSHTTAGLNPILFAAIGSTFPYRTLSYLRWDGDDFTIIKTLSWMDNDLDFGMHFGVFVAPGVKTANVTYALTGGCRSGHTAWSYTGAAQANALGVIKFNLGSGTSPSLTMENSAGQLIVDSLMSSWALAGVGTHSAGANQTNRGGVFVQEGDNRIRFRQSGGDEIAASPDVAMTWTINASRPYGHAAVPINPPPTGTRGYVVMSKMRDFMNDLKGGLVPPNELHNRYRGLKEQGLLTI